MKRAIERLILPRLGGLAYGADYNPELWQEEVWTEDVRLMREAHVNLVTLGVFSWSKIEPVEGQFDFGWLDRVFDLLHGAGVRVDLATPTASPPPWLAKLHPEILPVTAAGVPLHAGSRRHYCPHTPAYREAATRVALALAEHFRDHPALALWHVDNEYGCHVTECFCANSREAFRTWLRRRYGSLDALNNAWATLVWGQRYTAWDEIEPPGPLPYLANPSQEVDWQRFWSDSWVESFEDQKAILRAVTPGIPITTNFMGFYKPLDYWSLAAREDVVSQNTYPETSDPEWMIDTAMIGDLMRSLGGGRPWLLMEQAIAFATWRERNSTKRPGVMRLGSYQSVARGADGVMFFQWRSAPAGPEMHLTGMVGHDGTDNRHWREAAALGTELERLSEVRGSQVRAGAAIVFDWENWWALESEGKLSAAIRLMPLARAMYRALFKLGVTVDFVRPGADLSGYALVVAPHLYLVDDPAAENLGRYVEGGGTLLVTFFSGLVDRNDHVRLGGYPAPFRDILGLRIEEFAPFAGDMANSMRTARGRSFACSTWADVIRLEGAESIAAFESDFYAGLPAVTRHEAGRGVAFYLGTLPEEGGLDWLVAEACAAARLRAMPADSGIEAVRRTDGTRSWLFVLNHSQDCIEVPLERPGWDLISGRPVGRSLRLDPVDLAVIREEG